MYDHFNLSSLVMQKIMFYWSMGCTIHMASHINDNMLVLDSEVSF
jgi:hypothetical protein